MANYAVDSLQDGCYPGTVVLINTLNIRNQADLDAVEGTIVPAKAALWEEKPLAESFDFAHYCAIHRFLFEDLYEWAGKPRTGRRQPRYFCFPCWRQRPDQGDEEGRRYAQADLLSVS